MDDAKNSRTCKSVNISILYMSYKARFGLIGYSSLNLFRVQLFSSLFYCNLRTGIVLLRSTITGMPSLEDQKAYWRNQSKKIMSHHLRQPPSIFRPSKILC